MRIFSICFVIVGFVICVAQAEAQSTSGVTIPPQQMTAYGVPENYPTTATPTAEPTLPLPAEGNTNNVDISGIYTPYGSPDAMTLAQLSSSHEPWIWQILPPGMMYKTHIAGIRESRLSTTWVHDRELDWLWEPTIGARAALIRYGTPDAAWPQGWQLEVEGGCFPRLFVDSGDMISNDYRVGIPLTTRQGRWEGKLGYYHYCSHICDEYLLKNPGFPRINYVRNEFLAGLAYYLNPSLRIYSEAAWAFDTDGGAKPWEFQFGADLAPPEPTGGLGSPFFGIAGHLREENDFGGNLTVQTGWMWRGNTGRTLRLGLQYFNGMSEQAQFYNRFEEQIGIGLWYDF